MVEFPNLSILMASVSMTKKQLAEIIKKAPSSVTGKLSGKRDFRITEMEVITLHFQGIFPERNLTMQYIFCRKGNYSYQEQKGA
jgi:hypothetical protein